MQKILEKKKHSSFFFPFLGSICASSRPLHLSRIRYFLWKFHRHLGFLKHCRCWRLWLWGGEEVVSSSLSSPLSSTFSCVLVMVRRGEGGTHWHCRATRASSPAALTAASAHFSELCLLFSFQFHTARQRGIIVCMYVAAENTPRGLRSNEIGAPPYFACVDAIVQAKCVFKSVCAQLMQCRCILSLHWVTMSIWITEGINSGY